MTTAAGQAGPLSSDHINYLILRYLQEAGHEASATAFYRDWRRPAEYRDPEDLPFAHSVQRHELVSVIQDGLYHDELVSRVRKDGRRFNFTTNGSAGGSRPGTASKGKGRLDQMRRGAEDFPTPPPKRQRKSEEGPQERQINGAAEPMEVDAASPSAGDAEDDAEGASPAVQTPEPEIVEVPERYDSMDVAVQTEGKSGPKTSTMYWRVNKPDATILHNTFSPANESRALFTGGEGVSQFYDIPGEFDSGVDKISSLDDISTGTGSVVTACAWHPHGRALAFAVDSVRDIGVGGKQERRQLIKSHDAKSSRTTQHHSPPVMEPQGIVLALRYSWDGSQLLAVRTNGSRGSVEVWDTGSEANTSAERCAHVQSWGLFDGQALDAAWVARSEFVVCGQDGFLQRFRVVPSRGMNGDSKLVHNSKTARMHGLEVLDALDLSEESRYLTFDKIRVSTSGGMTPRAATSIVALASEDNTLVQGLPDSSETHVVPASLGDGRISALAFQPTNDVASDSNASRLNNVLALARDDGHIAIYQLFRDLKALVRADCRLADGSPALALAWSPAGSYLAVSGVDIVQIWEAAPLVDPDRRGTSTRSLAPDPVVTWRRDKSTTPRGLRNGEHAWNGAANGIGDEPLPEPVLSWTSDAKSLALAVGNEVSDLLSRLILPELYANECPRLRSSASAPLYWTAREMGRPRPTAMVVDLLALLHHVQYVRHLDSGGTLLYQCQHRLSIPLRIPSVVPPRSLGFHVTLPGSWRLADRRLG